MSLVPISNPSSATDPLVNMDNQLVRQSVEYYGKVQVQEKLDDQSSFSATFSEPIRSQAEKEMLLGLIGLIEQEDE